MTEQQFYKEAAKEMNRAKAWIGTETANLMRKKLATVYDKLIDKFYASHTPTSYKRQDAPQFKPVGTNLYRALQEGSYDFNRVRPGTNVIDGSIKLDATDMVEYRYKESKSVVLDYVLNGIRYPSFMSSNGIHHEALEFITEYTDNECKAEGTILEILNSVRDQLGDKYAQQALEHAKKKLKLEYITLE